MMQNIHQEDVNSDINENECFRNEETDDHPTVLLLDFLKANNVLVEAVSVEKSKLMTSMNDNFESTPVFEEDLLHSNGNNESFEDIINEDPVEDVVIDINNNEIE